MKKWMLALVVAGIGALGIAQAGSYGYGSCSNNGCCDPCGTSCDPCCQPCNPCCDPCCDPCWDPCCDWCDCGSFEVIGEYLYIRPHLCDTNFAITDTRDIGTFGVTGLAGATDTWLPSGKEHGICPDYNSAFRVGLGYLFNCGCNDIEVTYTRLETTDKRCIRDVPNGGGIWITAGNPRYAQVRLNNGSVVPALGAGIILYPTSPVLTAVTTDNAFARSSLHTEYDMVDGVVATRSLKGCDLFMRGFVGLRWAEFQITQKDTYRGTITYLGDALQSASTTPALSSVDTLARYYAREYNFYKDKSKTWGIGPRFGADLSYNVCCGFGLGAHVGASLLVGEANHNLFQTVRIENQVVAFTPLTTGGTLVAAGVEPNVTTSGCVRNHSRCVLFPEVDARLGVNYLWCCGDCFSLFFEVGWEFVSYINAIGHISFNDIGATSTETCESFNMDGLYVTLKLTI